MTFSCRIKVQSKAISPHDPAQWRWTMSQIVHVACGQHTCDFYGDAPLCLLTNISVDSLDLLKPQCTVTYPDSINVLFDTDLSIFILICSSLVQLLKQIWDGQSDQQKKTGSDLKYEHWAAFKRFLFPFSSGSNFLANCYGLDCSPLVTTILLMVANKPLVMQLVHIYSSGGEFASFLHAGKKTFPLGDHVLPGKERNPGGDRTRDWG